MVYIAHIWRRHPQPRHHTIPIVFSPQTQNILMNERGYKDCLRLYHYVGATGITTCVFAPNIFGDDNGNDTQTSSSRQDIALALVGQSFNQQEYIKY
ncbi:unnamed protein product [Medioppia subpectinata]|uniref:Uncharacterized protein n=1 Tax=Medioppia subpectinata TaxID=1979941 RepID=A0A7R9KFJ5_9ACAR|nr:unnamed protein product [Medioppia subpectinata]CAG2102620.1 unnamed protein product [Medioppia subpectinata]